MIIKAHKHQTKPLIVIDDSLSRNVFSIIDKATSYKIKNAEHIDNRMWSCKKCGWWKLQSKATSDYCKRCGEKCVPALWDCVIRLTSQMKNGQYYFPMGLLDSVRETLKPIGIELHVSGWPSAPHSSTLLDDLTWIGYDLRSHQDEAVVKALPRLWDGLGTILMMPTGSGKSLLAMYMIHELRVKTLILVHKKNLMEQWQKGIKQILNYETGLYGDGVKNIKPITIGMIQTIAKDRHFNINEFDFIVTDECVAGDTSIETNIGRIEIQKIVKERMDLKVKTHTGKMKKIKNFYEIKNKKPMVRVSYEGGQIECTEDHKILTARGWIEAKDLLPGKDVVYKHAEEKRNI